MIKVNSTLDFVSELFFKLMSRLSMPRPRSRATTLFAVDGQFLVLVDEEKPILAAPRILK
ncbi:MAG: hypothetical protein DRN68_09010 [Thaumarchaeota archaeon]|nr:MAG: hypothetical protein DRN68_09010 [Nitrososphaerota archaeon]